MPSANTQAAVQLDLLPGHAIRRLQQISTGIFHQEMQDLGITPVQYSALQTVQDQPGIDQRTLANLIALDASTTAGVVDRLEARGLLARSASPTDRRVRLLSLTAEGEAMLAQVLPAMLRVQDMILAPLPPDQREDFMRMLRQLITANNEFSRAPSDTGRANGV
jgi:DNA-binding MarR family transcriptional regulator